MRGANRSELDSFLRCSLARTVTIHNDDDDVPHGAASETTSMWVSRVTVGAAFIVTLVALFVFRSRLRAIRSLKARGLAS